MNIFFNVENSCSWIVEPRKLTENGRALVSFLKDISLTWNPIRDLTGSILLVLILVVVSSASFDLVNPVIASGIRYKRGHTS